MEGLCEVMSERRDRLANVSRFQGCVPLGVSPFVPWAVALLTLASCAHGLGFRPSSEHGICEVHLPAFRDAPNTAIHLGPVAGCKFMREFAERPIFREDGYEGPAARQMADKYCRCSAAIAKYDPRILGEWKISDVDATTDPIILKVLASSHSQIGPVGTAAGRRMENWVKNSADLPTLKRIAATDTDPERHIESSCIDYKPYWSTYGSNTAFDVLEIGVLAQIQIREVEAREAARLRDEKEREAARLREEADKQAAEERQQAELEAIKRNAELEAKRTKTRYLLDEAAKLTKKNNPDEALEAVTEAKRLGAAEDPETASQLRDVELAIENTPSMKKRAKAHEPADQREAARERTAVQWMVCYQTFTDTENKLIKKLHELKQADEPLTVELCRDLLPSEWNHVELGLKCVDLGRKVLRNGAGAPLALEQINRDIDNRGGKLLNLIQTQLNTCKELPGAPRD